MGRRSGLTLAARVYRWVTRLYPAPFREEYDRELESSFREQIAGAAGATRARVAAGAAADVLATAPRMHLDLLRQDLRYAWRTLTAPAQRAFAASAVVTLALGTGAAAAVFSVVYAVLLAPLPYRDADRLVRVYETNAARGITAFSVSVPNLDSWQRQVASVTLAAARDAPANLTDRGEALRVTGLAVTANFFETLGLPLIVGRPFSAAEDRPGGPRVALISEGLWQSRYGGSGEVAGRSILVDGVAHAVIGVVPQDVGFSRDVDLWVPLMADPAAESRGDKRLDVVARLAPGVAIDQAQSELQAVASALAREFPADNGGWSARVEPIFDWIVGAELPQRMRLLVLAVILLLAVACASVANLQMARAATRSGEMGVRLALGASRARLLRQTLTESLLLAGAGALAGVALAFGLVHISRAALPGSIPRLADVSLNATVLAAALLSTLIVAVVSGLLPALLAGRADIREALQHGGRSSAGAARAPVRHALVALQLALSTCLVAGAALLLQSTWHMQRQPLGFTQPERLLTASLTRPQGPDWDMGRDLRFYDAVLADAAALPGVETAALSSGVPLARGNTGMEVSSRRPPRGEAPDGVQASWRIVSSGYFDAMDMPMLRGRTLDPSVDPRRSMVISQALARQLWPAGEDPIGRTAYLGNGQAMLVVGVTGDVRMRSLVRDPAPAMYFPTSWYVWPTMTVVLRTSGDPAALGASLRAAVARVDPAQPIFDVETMSAIVGRRVAEPRLNAALLAIFAALALALAAVGVAGVMAFTVARRTPELAVRQALGASPSQAMQVVFASGLKLCAAGILAGIAAALLLGQALAGLLYRVAPRDLPTLAFTSATLLAVAGLACWLPARRATRISPAAALRS